MESGRWAKYQGDRGSLVHGLREGKIEGSMENTHEHMFVSELISDAGVWNEQKIRGMFLPFEVDAILLTPIGESSSVDWCCWGYEESGNFSVKSAYRLHMGEFEEHEHTSQEGTRWWDKHVWGLSVLPKIKIFLWRFFHNLIPTAGNLKRHHVPVEGCCQLCKDRWDSSSHAIFFCPRIRRIWKNSGFWKWIKPGAMVEVTVIAEMVRRKVGHEQYEIWSILVWQMWIFVCRLLHEECDHIPPQP